MTKIYVFVNHNGFIMDFRKSGSTLQYTLDLHEAQDFQKQSQARFTIKSNGLSDDFCKIMEISHDSRW